MNYFAHAHLAATRSDDPHFALGAMLPDWIAWIGDRPRRVAHEPLAAGIRFHHRSDAAFHAAPRFLALVRDATEALQGAGLARGPARGAAHVGIELLLDGVLLTSETGSSAAYRAALGVIPDAARHLTWSRPESGERLLRVAERLSHDGPPRHLADPDRVAQATAQTLERRPRLRIPTRQIPFVASWAREALPRVSRDAATLLAETESAIGAREGA
jgi:acyl carrier protein phosphodiesterase